jgi:hypothetical protein
MLKDTVHRYNTHIEDNMKSNKNAVFSLSLAEIHCSMEHICDIHLRASRTISTTTNLLIDQ